MIERRIEKRFYRNVSPIGIAILVQKNLKPLVRLGFSRRPQHVDGLMSVELFQFVPGGSQILAGIELIRLFRKNLPDEGGHGKPSVGINVDLAHRAFGGPAKLLLGDAYRIGEFSPVFLDHLDVFDGN